MPLLDHFHPPLSETRHWESLHAGWSSTLADTLNGMLPDPYVAEEQIHAGPSVEIDVATFEGPPSAAPAREQDGSTATVPARTWSPPEPTTTLAAVLADDFEVQVFSIRAGHRLVAAIELVSPRNKDWPAARRAFAIKCASYLHQGVALIVADVVTDRRANLHHEIMDMLQGTEAARRPAGAGQYAVAYRPVRRQAREEIDLWTAGFAVGDALPTLPLCVTADLCLPVDLEATYTAVCRRRKLA